MESPKFYRDKEGNLLELQPAKAPSREQLAKELADAEAAVKVVDRAVLDHEKERKELEDRLDEIDKALKLEYVEQEKRLETYAFRKNRLAAYDSVPPADRPADNGAESEVAEDDEPEPTRGQPSTEDVADSLNLPADPDVPQEAAEDSLTPFPEPQEVVVRRRSRV